MNRAYHAHAAERREKGLPPLPLTAEQTRLVAECLTLRREPETGETPARLVLLLAERVPGGVAEAAKAKAEFLGRVVRGEVRHPDLSLAAALAMLARMSGGYGPRELAELLAFREEPVAAAAAKALGEQFHVLDVFDRVDELHRQGNPHAQKTMELWAEAAWFTEAGGGEARASGKPWRRRLRIFKVDGEINTDDLSPARHAPSRPDIPLHALFMGEKRFPGGLATLAEFEEDAACEPEEEDYESTEPLRMVAFVGDTVGTGSSRKSAVNSLLWHIGMDIPGVPNKRTGGIVLAGRIAPIFRDTLLDAGGLPVAVPVGKLATGDRVVLELHSDESGVDGKLIAENDDGSDGPVLETFRLPALYDDAYAVGGRVNLVIGQKATARARAALGWGPATCFARPAAPVKPDGQGYTLAQKMVGRACGKAGVLPGEACEPAMGTVGSQDTTGPMTRDELVDLACLQFNAGIVMQSFCHTAAYPTDVDRAMHQSLPAFIVERGGLALRPGDGIIHSWLNRLLVPDAVGTGGDSHTRFPLGISFAAGSGLVAFAAALGSMPLEMPESALVRFSGTLRPGLAVRDVVNAIPLFAIERGLMDAPGEGANRNVFNGRVMEMEGWDGLTVAQAFELTCASAERSAAAATAALSVAEVVAAVRGNVAVLKDLLANGYESRAALARRVEELEAWLAAPSLLVRDADARFAATVDVDLSAIAEPVVALPNNPDRVARLSAAAGARVDEVFIGSCMTNADSFRAAAKLLATRERLGVKRLWVAPPTRLVAAALEKEGVMDVFRRLGARIEIPGCSLCMGNQARVDDGATVFSTSTRNFDHRMGQDAQVYLGSAELAAVAAATGRIPAPAEYFAAFENNR